MFINVQKLSKDFICGIHNITDILDLDISSAGVNIVAEQWDDGLLVSNKSKECKICYSRVSEFYRGLGILVQHQGEASFEVHERARFDTLAFLCDNSRNAVNNPETVRKLIRHLAVCGYTALMPYTEDTYEIPEYPYFGYMRGRFTAEEIKSLDQYAGLFGIELIPCIQTLAHLNAIFKWDVFGCVRDTADILLADEEKTYGLIDAMVKSLRNMYSSRTVNIGMDEAFMLGRGSYAGRHGLVSPAEIMRRHLKRVVEICHKYDFKPMMWSDMFFRNQDSGIKIVDGTVSQDQIDAIPEDITLVHWDYVSESKEGIGDMLHKHKLVKRPVAFAGGAWKWSGYMPANAYSLWVGRNAVEACVENGIREVILTSWGDNGAEASLFSVIPVIQQYAEGCYSGDMSDEAVNKRMKVCFHADLEGFLALDLPNLLPGGNESPGRYYKNPAKYLLFQDVLCGLFDHHVLPDEFRAHFDKALSEIRKGSKGNPQWKYIFDVIYAMTKVLQSKSDMGIRIRQAVLENNRAALDTIANSEIPLVVKWVEKLHKAVKIQWETENKIFGYEVQDIRLGALETRLKTAAARLNDYVNGKTDRLEEVECERLPYQSWSDPEGCVHVNAWFWKDIVTASVL